MLALAGLLGLMAAGYAVTEMMSPLDTQDEDDADRPESEARDDGFRPLNLKDTPLGSLVMGGAGDDILSGGAGDDEIRGWGGDDIIEGGEGRDSLFGQKGDDLIRLGAGDLAYGGFGADRFDLNIGAERSEEDSLPEIGDFEIGLDRLRLTFDEGQTQTPVIEIDEVSLPSNTVILADGKPIAYLSGVTGLTLDDIDITLPDGLPPVTEITEKAPAIPEVELEPVDGVVPPSDLTPDLPDVDVPEIDQPEEPAPLPDVSPDVPPEVPEPPAPDPVRELTQSESLVLDFNPNEDGVELLYDPLIHPDPQISVTEENGQTLIALDGQVVLTLSGVTGLNPAAIVLQPIV